MDYLVEFSTTVPDDAPRAGGSTRGAPAPALDGRRRAAAIQH